MRIRVNIKEIGRKTKDIKGKRKYEGRWTTYSLFLKNRIEPYNSLAEKIPKKYRRSG